ncbi:Ferric enterobactin transport ATP-binding protein FepC [Pseudoalteromonas holothuriae]|uniref:Ferric enterobactin transport ATP-binding protein FepC n=1 Tax=Pseudoalteromonas holothuriae TaxID=2963714 RepID=A0A9W4QRB0_9GAMM|nr:MULTISPECIES: ABC transporter ATP-binding protein [unclassified Pseudoalteromonas]CAH9049832.1 Ferric enterobactin transport ATP-binding protein FepC [Pseudoalteromonas sp. CIP111854]CAH9051854.1 Ferric enterobactin transport ATP-binding protein FepC [Pseudoalteromonas sp. CIP111951]
MIQASSPPPMLSVKQLGLKVNQSTILNDISFDIKTGQFIGLLGPNGAGKSSLLRCIYRYTKPSYGFIQLLDKSIDDYSRQAYAQQVAVVLQEVPEQFNLAVFDVVAMGLTPHKPLFSSMDQDDKNYVYTALEKVGLTHKNTQMFCSLSGGEKQRVMIARAMVQRPKLLIMDEPTSHLDVKYQIQIMELAKSLGVSVLASFHDLNLACAISDSLLVLHQGSLKAQGKPQSVLTSHLLSDVFGVCADVSLVQSASDIHNVVPHIRYHYGYVK